MRSRLVMHSFQVKSHTQVYYFFKLKKRIILFTDFPKITTDVEDVLASQEGTNCGMK